MSLETLDAQITTIRAEAERTQNSYARLVDSVNADPNLSDAGKASKVEGERERTKTTLASLRQKEADLITAKRTELERRLFGLSSVVSSDPTQIIAYRDAQDRAARLADPDDARELLNTAQLSDDTSLTSAILAQSLRNGWHSVVREHTNTNPRSSEDLNDLQQLYDHQNIGLGAALAYAMF